MKNKFFILAFTLVCLTVYAAEKKISDLNSLTEANYSTLDVIPIVDVSASETKKTSIGELDNRYFRSVSILGVASGGTGMALPSAGNFLYSNGSSYTAIGASCAFGQVLKSNGTQAWNCAEPTTLGSLTSSTSGVTVTSGTNALIASASVQIATATSSTQGLLSAADWTTFNSKVTNVSVNSPLLLTGGISTPTISFSTSGVSSGASFAKVTVDGYGRVTSGNVLIASDIPSLDASKITTGIFGITNGGTGQSTSATAFAALSPLASKGDLLGHTGSNNIRVPVLTNGYVLTASSTAAAGFSWEPVTTTGSIASATITSSTIASSIWTGGTISGATIVGLALNDVTLSGTTLVTGSISGGALVNTKITQAVSSVTVSATILVNTGVVFVDSSSGVYTVTLPAASTARGVSIKLIKTQAANRTIVTATSGNVCGASSISLYGIYDAVTYVSDGSNWLPSGPDDCWRDIRGVVNNSNGSPSVIAQQPPAAVTAGTCTGTGDCPFNLAAGVGNSSGTLYCVCSPGPGAGGTSCTNTDNSATQFRLLTYNGTTPANISNVNFRCRVQR